MVARFRDVKPESRQWMKTPFMFFGLMNKKTEEFELKV
jgi:hypothetical protein